MPGIELSICNSIKTDVSQELRRFARRSRLLSFYCLVCSGDYKIENMQHFDNYLISSLSNCQLLRREGKSDV